ncbi:ComEA family DNA-binding protein [Pedobacter immunditicola]|uniref:ComEA family DNA-binding protein n=1 Tax=Pedobacter immunditicola TaxID=3133440 RepID=UPI0030AB97B2
MIKRLKDYFDLSKREFNGLLVLVFLIIGVLLAPLVYRWMMPFKPDEREARKAIVELEKVLSAQKNSYAHYDAATTGSAPYNNNKSSKTFVKRAAPRLFPFDPNTTEQEGWQALGFSEKQAKVIINYIGKGGTFRKPEDLQKMFVVSPAAYAQLKPYIAIKTVQQPSVERVYHAPSYKPAAAVMIEINGADSTALDQIRGIGPAFARRIIKYRERIGGFHKKEQLMEVYGLDSLKFSEIKDQVKVDATAVKKININTASIEDFKNHPYLRYKQVNAMIQYRVQHGNYGNFADLKKVAILTPELLEQLEPYISYAP